MFMVFSPKKTDLFFYNCKNNTFDSTDSYMIISKNIEHKITTNRFPVCISNVTTTTLWG